MEAASEAVDPYPDDPAADVVALRVPAGAVLPTPAPASRSVAPAPSRTRRRLRSRRHRLSADLRREIMWIAVVYLSAHILLLVAAILLDGFGHRPLQSELANWDGMWYRAIANHGYPHHTSIHQNNLGFFPEFPLAIWVLSRAMQLVLGAGPIWASTYAGVLISVVGGLIATVFVHRLAEGWWDRATARRAVIVFVVFPGSVIFSMVYSEGLLLPMAAVCIWALERRRWLLAGTMAALGTAVQPVGLLLIVVCGACAVRELWRHGPRARSFWMSTLATAMSGIGVAAVFAFMWAWTGNPLAIEYEQSHAWSEKTDALALVHQATRAAKGFDPLHFNHPPVNLNYVVGTVGAVLMLWELWLLWRSRSELTLPAIVWTLGITYFAFTSEYVPPNPRLIITAFPMLVLLARWCSARRFPLLVYANVVCLVGLSLLTFYHHVLRP